MWACGAQVVMQVSYLDSHASTLYFLSNQNKIQTNTLLRLRKIYCRRVAIMDQDTSAHLVAQSYGGSTHEALGSVVAP